MIVSLEDRRSVHLRVPRASLNAASENALAASDMALAAVQRATGHVWSGNRAGLLHELGRIGFELQARREALAILTELAETAPTVCPDDIAEPGHGRAA